MLKLFGCDISHTDSSNYGLVLDDMQVSVLKKSWRTETPDRISHKDEYKLRFPVYEKSKDFLGVTRLDDLLEPMLQIRHGTKMVKARGKSRKLCSQAIKFIYIKDSWLQG
jgi:hypothetical protein